MGITFSKTYYIRSITVLLGTVMLLSCKNDPQEVAEIVATNVGPDMVGYDLVMTYSDSARIQYKMITAEHLQFTESEEKYDEFPKGIYIIYYDKRGHEIGSIEANYARNSEDGLLWEARDEVVVINVKGEKMETEQLFWDRKKEMIYTDRYAKLTDASGQIMEGNAGFESDQNMTAPVFRKVTGQMEVEKNSP